MKIIIVGGHLAPALAVIEAMPKVTKIIFAGRKYALEGDKALSLEYQKISNLQIPFINLTTGRLQRRFTRHTIPSLLKLPYGFIQALILLKTNKPDCVVCFGGYLQIPICFAAYLLRIPVIIHEQTIKAGLANKIASRFAMKICISWQESAKYFPKEKTVLTGLPIRKEFLKIKNIPLTSLNKEYRDGKEIIRDKTIYITGGSLGAHGINTLVEGTLEKLLKKYYIIHQTGDAKEFNDFGRLEEISKKLPPELRSKYYLVKFIDPEKIAKIMAHCDLVVSRSGINTISELIYLRKKCLLIPLPHGQTNEQLDNALFIQRLGLGRVLIQDELTPEILYSQIAESTATLSKEPIFTQKIQDNIIYDAADKIVKIINETQKTGR